MASKSRLGRPAILWVSILLATCSTVATTTFLIILAVVLFSTQEAARIMASLSVALQGLSLVASAMLFTRELLYSSITSGPDPEAAHRAPTRHRSLAVSLVLTTLASIASIVTTIWMGIVLSKLKPTAMLQPSSLLACLATTCGISIVSSATTFILLCNNRDQSAPTTTELKPTSGPAPGPEMAASSDTRPQPSAKSHRSTPSNPFLTSSESSTRPQTPNSISLSSLRSSLTFATSSNTCRSPLATSRPNSHISSRPNSHADPAFEQWDTSTVPIPPLRDTTRLREGNRSRTPPPIRVHTTTSSKLPPIPGSRPASPARPLDSFSPLRSPYMALSPPGPAATLRPTTSPTTSSPTLNSPTTTLTTPSPTSAHHTVLPNPHYHNQGPPDNPSPSLSRTHSENSLTLSVHPPTTNPRSWSSTSLADSVSHLGPPTARDNDEANIHPLFRSGSPSPVICTRGTVLTAASIGDALETAGVGAESKGGRSRGASLEVVGVRRARSRDSMKRAESSERMDAGLGLMLGGKKSKESLRMRAVTLGSAVSTPVTSPLAREFSTEIWKGLEDKGSEKAAASQDQVPSETVSIEFHAPDEKRDAPEQKDASGKEGVEKSKGKGMIPIPDFILSSGKRGSLVSFERRKSNKKPARKKDQRG